MDHQVTMQPELVMIWVLSDPPSYKVRWTHNCLFSNRSGTYIIRPKQVLKAQTNDMRKLPKCLWFLLPLQCLSAAKHAHNKHHIGCALVLVPYYWLAKEENTRAQFTSGSAQYEDTTKKWVAVIVQPLSVTTLTDNSKGKSLCRTPGSTHSHTFCLEGEMARCIICFWIKGYSQCVGKINEKGIPGKKVWIQLSKQTKNEAICIPYEGSSNRCVPWGRVQ